GRVSGIGSMGRLRYAVLVAGKDGAGGRYAMLEFKEARPSAYDLCRDREKHEGALAQRAGRGGTGQAQGAAAGHRVPGWALDGGQSFQVRQLGPRDLRLELQGLSADDQAGVARVQAQVLARVHARSAARAVGPANALAELAEPDDFCQRVLAFALGYADV